VPSRVRSSGRSTGLVSLALESVAGSERVEVELDDGAPPVRVDPAHIERVLANLLENALAATSAGGRVVVRGAAEGDELWIRVDDGGAGLDAGASELERASERG